MSQIEKAVNAQRDVLLMAVNSDDYTQARCANYLSPERVRELLELEASRAPSPAVREALEACRRLDAVWSRAFPKGPDHPEENGVGLSDETRETWRMIRAALSGPAPAAPTYDDAVKAAERLTSARMLYTGGEIGKGKIYEDGRICAEAVLRLLGKAVTP